MDYVALKSEIQNDPQTLGYAALVSAGNDAGIAAALNLARAGASYSIFRPDVGVREMIAAVASSDFASLTALQVAKLTLLFSGTLTLNAADSNTRAIVSGIFTGMTTTLNNFTALAKRQGSRAEVLWGAGVTVSGDDVAKALRG